MSPTGSSGTGWGNFIRLPPSLAILCPLDEGHEGELARPGLRLDLPAARTRERQSSRLESRRITARDVGDQPRRFRTEMAAGDFELRSLGADPEDLVAAFAQVGGIPSRPEGAIYVDVPGPFRKRVCLRIIGRLCDLRVCRGTRQSPGAVRGDSGTGQ